MRKIILIQFVLCSMSIQLFANTIQLPVQKVIIFPQSAEINRKGTVQLKKGTHQYTIPALSPYLNENSIRLSLSDGELINFTKNNTYEKVNRTSGTTQILKDSIAILNKLISEIASNENALLMQIEVIKHQQHSPTGVQQHKNIQEIKELNTYIAQKIPLLYNEQYQLSLTKKRYTDRLKIIQTQYNTLVNPNDQLMQGELTLEIYASGNKTIEIEFIYHTAQVGWNAEYHIKASDFGEKITLEYRANIHQNCTENWENIQLTIATGNLSISVTPPSMYPWYIYDVSDDVIVPLKNNQRIMGISAEAEAPMKFKLEEKRRLENSPTPVKRELMNFHLFELPEKFSLAHQDTKKGIVIKKSELTADFYYYALPKLSNKVYLQAAIRDLDKSDLLPGESIIFFQNTYVGKSYINPLQMTDTLQLDLGHDPNIITKRTLLKTEKSQRLLSNNTSSKQQYEITIYNNKNKAISLLIKDQIPIATDNLIKSELSSSLVHQYNEKEGFVEWKIDILPKATFNIPFSFEVTYPKKYQIQL